MPDYAIDVAVEPDASSFPEQLAAAVSKAEARQPPVEVELEPTVGRGFARDAQRKVKAALAKIDAELPVEAKLSRTFRRDVLKLANEAMRGAEAEVIVAPTLPRNFRARLNREIQQALRGGKPLEAEITPKIGRGFRSKLQAEIRSQLTATPVYADVQMRVDRRAYADFLADLTQRTRAAAEIASLACQISPNADMSEFTRELFKEVTLAVEVVEAGAPEIDVAVDVDTGAARAQLASLDTSVGKTSKGLSGLSKLLALGAVAGLAGLLATAVAGFAGAAVASANFEGELSNLEAVASATSDQMAELREQALQAGIDTAFSASEAAQAQTELAKAGVGLGDILSGGLLASLNLATAGELELAEAAVFVSTGLNVFKLAGEDAGRVADSLAAAANKSAADVSDIGPAFAQSALVAQQLGLSLEDTTGTIALFAQQGLKGSDAGTSFRTMLLRLNPQSKEAAETMADLGLQFFDAEGKFVGIEAAAGQLQTQLAGLTDEQRSAALQTIFGTDAIRAANILYDQGAGGVAEWTAAVTDSGFAADVAATKLDNLKGDLEVLRGSLETVFIEAGTAQNSGLRSIVQSLTEVVNVAGPGLAAAIAPIGELIGVLAPRLGELMGALSPALESLGTAATPIIAELVDTFSVLLLSLVPIFDALLPFGEAFGAILEAAQPLLPVIGRIIAAIGDALTPILGSLAFALEPLVELFAGGLMEALDVIAPALETVGAEFGRLIRILGPLLTEILGSALEELRPQLPEIAEALTEMAVAFVDLTLALLPILIPLTRFASILFTRVQLPIILGLAKGLTLIGRVLEPWIRLFAERSPLIFGLEKFTDLLTFVTRNISFENLGKLGSILAEVGRAVGSFFADLPGIVGGFLADLPGLAVEALSGLGQLLWDSFTFSLAFAGTAIFEGLTSLLAYIIGFPFQVLDALLSLPSLLADVLSAGWRIARERIPQIAGAILGFIAALPGRIAGFLSRLPGQIAGFFTTAFSAARDAVSTGIGWVVELISGLPGRIAELATNLALAGIALGGSLIDGLREGLSRAVGVAGDIASGVVSALIGALNTVIDKINDAIPNKLGSGLLTIDLPDNPIPKLARGALITTPTLALVGEAGPELVLPLNDRERLLQLLQESGLLSQPQALPQSLSAAGVAAVSQGVAATQGGPDPATLAARTSTEQLEAWADEVVAILLALGLSIDGWADSTAATFADLFAQRIPNATLPALSAWRTQAIAVAREAADGMAGAWRAGVGQLGPIASLGAGAAVAAVTTQLSGGTGEVSSIVRGYAGALASALNPLLRAVGKPQLPERYARGGLVPGPNVERDVVPALLMPGEVVIRKASVERFGLANLLAINEGRIRGMAQGGEVAAATGGADLRGRAVERAQAAASGFGSAFPPLPPALAMLGAIGDAGRGSMAHAHAGARDWLAQSSEFGSGSAAAAAVWIRTAMALTGVPDSWFVGLMTIARRESGFNPRAINLWDSNAAKGIPSKGLMQTIDPTFSAHALPGLRDIWNPIHNAVAAIRYILSRYGDISAVAQANPTGPPRGYAEGGLVTADGLYVPAARMRPSDVAAMTRQGAPGSSGGSVIRQGPTIEGNVILKVEAPAATDPAGVAMALSHRIIPALSAALARVG